ncbi:MAG: DUF5808 domain-containing protein [bacterium]
MVNIKLRRTNIIIEAISVFILLLQLLIIFTHKPYHLSVTLPPLIINICMLILLSIVMYFSLSPKIVFKEFETPELFGERKSLKQNVVLFYYKRGVFYTSLFKLLLLLIPFGLQLSSLILFRFSNLLKIIYTIFMIILVLFILTLSITNFLKANGFESMTIKKTLSKVLFYYNPKDKRAVVEKQFGVGTTINFASKQGRLILYVLLAIPITIIGILFLVLVLSKKF